MPARLVWSSDVWWAWISVSIITATYVLWFCLSFPIMTKVH